MSGTAVVARNCHYRADAVYLLKDHTRLSLGIDELVDVHSIQEARFQLLEQFFTATDRLNAGQGALRRIIESYGRAIGLDPTQSLTRWHRRQIAVPPDGLTVRPTIGICGCSPLDQSEHVRIIGDPKAASTADTRMYTQGLRQAAMIVAPEADLVLSPISFDAQGSSTSLDVTRAVFPFLETRQASVLLMATRGLGSRVDETGVLMACMERGILVVMRHDVAIDPALLEQDRLIVVARPADALGNHRVLLAPGTDVPVPVEGLGGRVMLQSGDGCAAAVAAAAAAALIEMFPEVDVARVLEALRITSGKTTGGRGMVNVQAAINELNAIH